MAETTNANGVTLLEGLEEWEKHQRAEGAHCNAELLKWARDEIVGRRQAVEDYRSGAREADRQIATLLGEVRRLTGPAEHMRHTKTHTYYTVLARGAQMQCAFPVSDYDKVTVYRGADGTLWVRPDAEFWDGKRFVPSDTPFKVDPLDLSTAVEG